MISNVHIIQVWNENNQNFRLGLAHRTSEKQRPGPLDLALLFQEVTRVKKLSKPSSSMRDLLMSSIQEYNRLQTNKSWRVTESDRKLVYNVIRCPVLLQALKEVADFSAWQHSCFTLENLDSDFYVPGTVLAPCNTNQLWKDLKVGHWNFNLLIFVDWNLFFVNSPWAPADCFRGERDLVDTTRFGGASKESAQGLHCQAKGRCCDEKHSRLSFFCYHFLLLVRWMTRGLTEAGATRPSCNDWADGDLLPMERHSQQAGLHVRHWEDGRTGGDVFFWVPGLQGSGKIVSYI